MKVLPSLFAALSLWSNAIANPIPETPPAVSVSPGGIEGPTWVTDRCPVFNWASVPEAVGYELAIFQARYENALSFEVQAALDEPMLEARIPAPALSWSSTDAGCLQDGWRYFWYVRALYHPGAGPWSEARHFDIDVSGVGTESRIAARPLAIPGPPYLLNLAGNAAIQGVLEIPGLSGPASGDPVCSQQDNNGLLVRCDPSALHWGATIAGTTTICANATCMITTPSLDITPPVENCLNLPTSTWLPDQSRTVSANCPAEYTAIAGGCSIANGTSWTYAKAVQIVDGPFGASWECAWVMPPSP